MKWAAARWFFRTNPCRSSQSRCAPARDTLVQPDGSLRTETLAALRDLLKAAAEQGLIVDVTFTKEQIRDARTGAGDTIPFAAYREAIETAVSLARETAVLIRSTPHLELIREPDLGVVLFRRLGWEPADYDKWAQALHNEEIAFIPPTKWEGETVGRFAFLHPHTTMELVKEILDRTT